jgi:hypothetical protein
MSMVLAMAGLSSVYTNPLDTRRVESGESIPPLPRKAYLPTKPGPKISDIKKRKKHA